MTKSERLYLQKILAVAANIPTYRFLEDKM